MSLVDPRPDVFLDTHYSFFSDAKFVHLVLQRVVDDLTAFKLSEDLLASAEILMAEVINNIIEHAYQSESNQPIEMSLLCTDTTLKFVFLDFGHAMPFGMPPSETPSNLTHNTEQLPEGGFGWPIIRKLSKNIQYSRRGKVNALAVEMDMADAN